MPRAHQQQDRCGAKISAVSNGPFGPFFVLKQRFGVGPMTADELSALLEPTVERLGYELSDLEARLGGSSGVIRVFIDHPKGIGLDDCEKVMLRMAAHVFMRVGGVCDSTAVPEHRSDRR